MTIYHIYGDRSGGTNKRGGLEKCDCAMGTKPLKEKLPDIHDEQFLEVLIATGVDYLVTGNIKHYPREAHHSVKVVTPREFLEVYRNNVR